MEKTVFERGYVSSQNAGSIMKIAYILPISWGGIPHYTAELANAVSKYADVTVLKPKDPNDELFSGDVKVINAFKPMHFSRKQKVSAISPKNIVSLFSFRNIKLIDDINNDIVHFPELYPQSSIFAFLYRIHKRHPIVSTLHATFDSLLSLLSTKNIYGILASFTEFTKWIVKSDVIIVHTKQDKETLVKKGVNPKNIAVIPHGSYTFFKNYAKNVVNSDDNNILHFGYIGENKGIEYLIKAIPIVSQAIPDIKVIIAGEGNFSKYSKLIEDCSKFEIYNEYIPNEKVPELFQRAKVVVLPYTYHRGHSGVLNIAFAFGKPAIVTNVGSLPEMVEYGKSGLIVPPKNPEALAEAIIKLLKDDELRKKMSKNALKRAEELSWDNIAKMHMKVYEEVLNERRSRS